MAIKNFLLPVLLFLFTPGFAQNKKDLKISLSTGMFNSTHYKNAKRRQFYNLSFDYAITNRHTLSADFISGQHRYYDSLLVTTPIPLSTPGWENHTNADARTVVFSVMYKYRLLNHKKFLIQVGSGLGIITESYTYPVDLANGGFTFESTGVKGDLCFPIRLDMDYKMFKNFQIGILTGVYIYPDYPLVGEHLGLRLSYVIK